MEYQVNRLNDDNEIMEIDTVDAYQCRSVHDYPDYQICLNLDVFIHAPNKPIEYIEPFNILDDIVVVINDLNGNEKCVKVFDLYEEAWGIKITPEKSDEYWEKCRYSIIYKTKLFEKNNKKYNKILQELL